MGTKQEVIAELAPIPNELLNQVYLGDIMNLLRKLPDKCVDYDWLYFNLVKNVSKEKTFHACQIPQQLAELLIRACTLPGDVVLVQFGGSGSELEVCKRLGRQFVSAEIDDKYYRMIQDRLARGTIEEKYRLAFQKRNRSTAYQQQLVMLENSGTYTVDRAKQPSNPARSRRK